MLSRTFSPPTSKPVDDVFKVHTNKISREQKSSEKHRGCLGITFLMTHQKNSVRSHHYGKSTQSDIVFSSSLFCLAHSCISVRSENFPLNCKLHSPALTNAF